MGDFAFYPIQDYGPLMKGLAIGGLGIFHVFLAQFAIGAGFVLCLLQWRAWKRGDELARRFLDGFFTVLVLVSFVLGAVTGVAMWFTSIQVSPRTIGMMIDEFHWVWATEWLFFGVEVAAGYAFYRYRNRLTDSTRMLLLVAYSVAGWMSLFWINGILSWQLTPGEWLLSGGVWDGFFNPSFWPSLLYRTFAAATIAALVAILVVHVLRNPDGGPATREDKTRLIRSLSILFLPTAAMPLLGLWYLATIPEDSRSWLLGGSPAMSMFLAGAVATSTALGVYAVVGLFARKLYVNVGTAALLVGLAFVATGAGEFVREGSRKPYTVREVLFSNSLTREDVDRMRREGSAHRDPYPIREEVPDSQLELGARVMRLQCSVCHTMDGANGMLHLVGPWQTDQMRMNIAKLQHTKPFMPPFAGNAEELEALVQYLSWHRAGRPAEWRAEDLADVLVRNQIWLDEAGTAPGRAHQKADGR